ncbi:oxygenase MpaB family protein [Rhizobium leguminosarum]|uniref:oxygenase MpaB family protein n=1 Tax=Rhizobium leguminosarum TaxID=384 RepID=UPI003F9AF920
MSSNIQSQAAKRHSCLQAASPGGSSRIEYRRYRRRHPGGSGAICQIGVWDYSSFRKDAVMRLRRTGAAAMMTGYGPRPVAERMIARVGRRRFSAFV